MVFALIIMLFPYPFVRMFASDSELIVIAVKYLPVFISGMLIFGIQKACQTTFVAMDITPFKNLLNDMYYSFPKTNFKK